MVSWWQMVNTIQHNKISYMKKLFITLIVIFFSLDISAEGNTTGIIVNKSDGSTVSIAIQQLQSIKFSDGNVIVRMKDNTQQSFNIDDITNMTFGDIATAIRVLSDNNIKSNKLIITDIIGHIIYNGTVANATATCNLPNGIYIISVEGKSRKVIIGGNK